MCRKRRPKFDLKLLQTVLLIALCLDNIRLRLHDCHCNKSSSSSSVPVRIVEKNRLKRLYASNRRLKQEVANCNIKTEVLERKCLPFSVDNNACPFGRVHVVLWRVQRNVEQLWNFLRHKLKEFSYVITYTRGWYQETVTDLSNLFEVLLEWKKQEANRLSQVVQNRFQLLQNPGDCSQARRLICDVTKACGLGCQMHHLVFCFMVAYRDNRTVIVDSYKWQYAPYRGSWETVFQPISNSISCRTFSSIDMKWWEKEDSDDLLVKLPVAESLDKQPPFIPLAVPKDLAAHISCFHTQPSLWWIGQIVSFLLRPSVDMQQVIDEFAKSIGFSKPIVGVHVRRTDKVGWESELHSLNQYMEVVESYYELLEKRQQISKRSIYLATDDDLVITEMKHRYPGYNILSNKEGAVAARQQRYSQTSLNGIITDILLLSQTDYLVCTFSSQVCRLAYELMQSYHPDASQNAHSLDEMYYFGGQRPRLQRAIARHTPADESELELIVGDLISVRDNKHGFFLGMSMRTNKYGRYPPYKVEDIVDEVKCPTFVH